MNSTMSLDTRTRYQGTRLDSNTTHPTSQTGSPDFVFFRREVQNLLTSHHRDRPESRKRVVDQIQFARDPMRFFNELIHLCVVEGGPDGLDIAIDVLSRSGDLVSQYAGRFRVADGERWHASRNDHRQHYNDDVWYVLLRAIAQSGLEARDKILMIAYCLRDGSPSIREAAVRAVGDLEGPDTARVLRFVELENDPSPMVREAVREVLADLEG